MMKNTDTNFKIGKGVPMQLTRISCNVESKTSLSDRLKKKTEESTTTANKQDNTKKE